MQKVIYSIIIALVITAGAASLSDDVSGELQNGIMRLHIVADSDEAYAQEVKLKVRDAVIENVSLNDKNFLEKAELEANRVLEENGEDYKAKAYYGKFYFPAKQYSGITLPAGEYYGVRLVLGRGAGQNWWCIMYPPMCVVNDDEMELRESSEKILKRSLSPGSYELITEGGEKIKIRFKTVEIIQSIKKFLSQSNDG